ncbi:MAG: hypothetical protein ACT4O3_04800 [Elusimicrobiota bacterium]
MIRSTNYKQRQNNFFLLLVVVLALIQALPPDTVASDEITKTVGVKYFYPKNGSQNPEGTPNWFYYWRNALGQNASTVKYDSSIQYGSASLSNRVRIGDNSNPGFSVPYNHTFLFGYPRPTLDGKSGSDLFTSVMAHELQHISDFEWVNANPGSTDSDGDFLPDAIDPFPNAVNGAGFSEYTEAWRGDWEYKGRQAENVSMPTSLDWACPGKQWNPCP